jgi:hypothetical protein
MMSFHHGRPADSSAPVRAPAGSGPRRPATFVALGAAALAAADAAALLFPAFAPLVPVVAVGLVIGSARRRDTAGGPVQTVWTLAQGLSDAAELSRISGLQPDLAWQIMHDAQRSTSPAPPPGLRPPHPPVPPQVEPGGLR